MESTSTGMGCTNLLFINPFHLTLQGASWNREGDLEFIETAPAINKKCNTGAHYKQRNKHTDTRFLRITFVRPLPTPITGERK